MGTTKIPRRVQTTLLSTSIILLLGIVAFAAQRSTPPPAVGGVPSEVDVSPASHLAPTAATFFESLTEYFQQPSATPIAVNSQAAKPNCRPASTVQFEGLPASPSGQWCQIVPGPCKASFCSGYWADQTNLATASAFYNCNHLGRQTESRCQEITKQELLSAGGLSEASGTASSVFQCFDTAPQKCYCTTTNELCTYPNSVEGNIDCSACPG